MAPKSVTRPRMAVILRYSTKFGSFVAYLEPNYIKDLYRPIVCDQCIKNLVFIEVYDLWRCSQKYRKRVH